jgi:uncharacterized membrane protein YfcA
MSVVVLPGDAEPGKLGVGGGFAMAPALQWAIASPMAAGAPGEGIGGRLIASKPPGPYPRTACAIVSAAVAVALFIKAISA